MTTRIRMVGKLPARTHGTRKTGSRYDRYFEAAVRNPRKFVLIPNTTTLNVYNTAKKHGIVAVQRGADVYVFKRRSAVRRRRSK